MYCFSLTIRSNASLIRDVWIAPAFTKDRGAIDAWLSEEAILLWYENVTVT